MQEIHGTASGRVTGAPDAVFRLITDVDRLPEWNRAIERVVERAPELAPGTEWVVKMHPSRGMTWQSRSRVEEIDMDAAPLLVPDLERGWQSIVCRLEVGGRPVRFRRAGDRQLGRISKDAGSQVAGRTDSPTAASQGSSRVATGARQGHP